VLLQNGDERMPLRRNCSDGIKAQVIWAASSFIPPSASPNPATRTANVLRTKWPERVRARPRLAEEAQATQARKIMTVRDRVEPV